ncbi:MAG TPA: helix-turn-helix transcriptional regulator [Candidatus Sulfotelmatobacter sp.]|jgi:AraC-like DNA-binding protein|nr:helix-turn-helix transcriptional regulator [Candidatus Sulfotelmatobacter sp.]
MSHKLKQIQHWPELARQANWSATALAKQCGVSGEILRQHFAKYMGRPPGAWLSEQRQRLALELLRDGSSIKETAACLGYKQQTNFTRKFKKFWGTCPSLPMLTKPKFGQNLRK